MLLQTGKTIRDIAKFAEIDVDQVTSVARTLDLEPATEPQRRGKALYSSAEALTFQEIAQRLAGEGFTGDDGAPMHHLTVASWVKNFGWSWGGSDDGDYAPERVARPQAKSKYTMRVSKERAEQINAPANVAKAAEAAWQELVSDRTLVVQIAVIKGAAAAEVTDLVEVKKVLMDQHGDHLRTAKVEPANT